jgi:hypothetical protein
MASAVSRFADEWKEWRWTLNSSRTIRENLSVHRRSSALVNGVIYLRALIAFTTVDFQGAECLIALHDHHR